MYYFICRSGGNSYQKNLVKKALEACNAEYKIVRTDKLNRNLLLDIVRASKEGFAEITASQSRATPSNSKRIEYIMEEATFNEAIDLMLKHHETLKSMILYDDTHKKVFTRFIDGWDRQLIGDVYAERAKKIKKQVTRQSYQASALALIGLWSEEEEALERVSRNNIQFRDSFSGNKLSQDDDVLY